MARRFRQRHQPAPTVQCIQDRGALEEWLGTSHWDESGIISLFSLNDGSGIPSACMIYRETIRDSFASLQGSFSLTQCLLFGDEITLSPIIIPGSLMSTWQQEGKSVFVLAARPHWVQPVLIISACIFWSSIHLCDLNFTLAFSSPGSTSKGGVHFPDDDENASINNSCDEKLQDKLIAALLEPDGAYLVKVGFLRSHHKYEIIFSLPQVPTLGKDVTLSPALRTTAKPRLRATCITPHPEGGVRVVCEYSAQQDGVVQEELTLVNRSRRDSSVRIRLQARVMERHHGTPMLLDGVRCVGEEKNTK